MTREAVTARCETWGRRLADRLYASLVHPSDEAANAVLEASALELAKALLKEGAQHGHIEAGIDAMAEAFDGRLKTLDAAALAEGGTA